VAVVPRESLLQGSGEARERIQRRIIVTQASPRRATRLLGPLLLGAASAFFGLLLSEAVLRTIFNPGDYLYATVVPDPILGQRIEPRSSGHDALGFRNREAPRKAGIVALGDSQTYGVGVPSGVNWPRQLEEMLQEPIYNMALGGFGPLEEMYLAEHEAPKLGPRLLLVGFYLGNDLADAFRTSHRLEYWHGWRETTTAVPDAPGEDVPGAQAPQKRFAALRDWLARHCVTYGFLRARAFRGLARMEKERLASGVSPDQQMVWADPADSAIRTIFTARKRLEALDTRRLDVQEGLRITERAFETMKASAGARSIRVLVVVIPTKERVYCAYLNGTGASMPGSLTEVCDDEERVTAEIENSLVSKGIEFVDTRKALEEGVRAHRAIYPQDGDGHPTAEGHRAIARAVFEELRRQRACAPVIRSLSRRCS
jgi:acetyltransferase AlgX (SGNH hydrolase-like protein)